MTNNNFKSKVILVLISLIIIIALGITYQVLALNPPTNQPPTGGGTIGVGSNAPGNSLYISSSGNVGIGTTGPGVKLHLAGGDIEESDGTNGFILHSRYSNGYDFWELAPKTSGTYQWDKGIILVRSSGNVGIGTTAPGQKLDISGNTILSGDYKLYLRDTNRYIGSGRNNDFSIVNKASTWLRIGSANGIAIWGTSGADTNDVPHIFIDTSGNVGIGTAAPDANLHVIGGICAESSDTGCAPSAGYVRGSVGLCIGADCRTLWPSGASLPSGSSGQTLRHNGTEWVANSIIYNNGTNVGIGTTAPGYKLDVSGDIGATGAVLWGNNASRTQTKNDAGAIASKSGFFEADTPVNYYSGASSWQHLIEARHSNNSNNYALQIAGSFFDQDLYFRKTNNSATTAWNKFIYQNSAGNVGIGTTAPGQKLDVQGAAQFGSGNVNLIDSTGKIAGISSTYFASLDGSALTSLNASNLASGTVPSARISGSYTGITGVGTLTAGTWTASSISTTYTAAKDTTDDSWTGTSNVYTTSGNVGIGTSAPTQRLQVNGVIGAYSDADSWIAIYPGGDTTAIIWDNAANPNGLNFSTWDTFNGGSYSIKATITNSGSVTVSGSVTAAAFYYGSDQSLKTNIKPFDKSLQKVLNLEPVYFDYKENNQHSLGFIAQDVEKQFPELVTTDSLTGLKSLDYSRLTAPLVMAIKEQQEQINALTQIVESQGQQINELKMK